MTGKAKTGLASALFLLLALAQVDLTLSPARLELALPKGAEAEERVVLRNGLPKEEAIVLRLAPFALDKDGAPVPSKERDLCPYLQGEGPPGGGGTLACLVVFAGEARPVGTGGFRLSTRPQLGLAVYLTLGGTEKPALRAKVGGEGKALPVVLENPGNVLQRVALEARVYDGEGKERARLRAEDLPVFPGGYREVFLAPEESLPPGRYRVALLVAGPYGRYAAEGVWDVP